MDLHSVIGGTPLIPLSGFCPNLFAKPEFLNLTGSVKDRAALSIVEDAESRGLLVPGSTIIEPTSGNMGISLAAIAAARGYRAIIVMPDSMSVERRRLIAAYGAEVCLTPGAAGMAGAIRKARELADGLPGSYIPGQFENPANALAHYRSTGPEIWTQTGGRVEIFVAGVGTGGTLTGTGKYLKEQNPRIQIVAVEPADSPVLSGGRAGSHGLQGIGAGFIPEVLDTALPDEIFPVTEADAQAAARRLAAEGILAGISSGAAVHAAAAVAARAGNLGKTVVTLLPDTGQRYLSTDLFPEPSFTPAISPGAGYTAD